MPPVEDHPVHEKTKKPEDYRNGCHSERTKNRTFPGYHAPNRIYDDTDGRFEVVQKFIPHTMSRKCRSFPLWDTEDCEGCKQPKDQEYANTMKGLK